MLRSADKQSCYRAQGSGLRQSYYNRGQDQDLKVELKSQFSSLL